MMALFTNIAPIALGFVAKLFAIKQHNASENQKLMMEQFAAKDKSINDAREMAKNESPMAAMNRRVIILVILGLIIFTQIAPPLLNLPTVIPTTLEGFNFFGIQFAPEVVEYVTIEAGSVVKFDEVFAWASMIIEFYFGAQLAKKS